MQTTDFTTGFTVSQSPEEVYNAINNVRGWWQGEIEGDTDQAGEEFSYTMKEFHVSKQKIVDLVPAKRVEWLVTESRLNFLQQKDEWTGTTIIFELQEEGNETKLRFTHHGLTPSIECYGACSNGWTKLIQQSLYGLVTTGKGKEVF